MELKKSEEMPCKMGTTIQCVIIRDTAYLGGGYAGNDHDSCTVMKLDLQRNEWTKLPQYNAKYFAMTSLFDQLLLIGGLVCTVDTKLNNSETKATNRITLINHKSEKMIDYPPMKTARHSSMAVCFNNHIIVAGGSDSRGRTHIVEVSDWQSSQWYNAESLPKPLAEARSAVIQNNLYLMGGRDYSGLPTSMVHKVDFNELIEGAKTSSNQATLTSWKTIQDTPLKCSSPLVTHIGALLAVGGYDDKNKPSSSVYLYQPDTEKWVKVGDLPIARYNSACSELPSGEVIVAGGETGLGKFSISYSSTADFLSIFIPHI